MPPTQSPFLNREIGILEFNRRVLAQAEDADTPLLERLRFLCIVSSNLDEFFEIRVAELKETMRVDVPAAERDGMSPREVFGAVGRIAHELVERQYQLLNENILPELAKAGVRFLRRNDLNEAQRAWVRDYFFNEMMPVLTPIGLDPAHPFPRVFNKSLNFAVQLEGRDAFGRDSRAAIVQAPRILPRMIRLPFALQSRKEQGFVFLLGTARTRVRTVRRHERARLLPVPRDAQQRSVRGRGGGEKPAHRAAGRTAAAQPGRGGPARSRR